VNSLRTGTKVGSFQRQRRKVLEDKKTLIAHAKDAFFRALKLFKKGLLEDGVDGFARRKRQICRKERDLILEGAWRKVRGKNTLHERKSKEDLRKFWGKA